MTDLDSTSDTVSDFHRLPHVSHLQDALKTTGKKNTSLKLKRKD